MKKATNKHQARRPTTTSPGVEPLLALPVHLTRLYPSSATNREHTVGPWSIDPAFSANGLINSETGAVAQIIELDNPDDETAANARLIAAAPDLLAACEAAAAMPDGCPVSEWNSVRDMLRAAIAKATVTP